MGTYLIITTVGTSVFSNFNKQKVKLAFTKSREGKDVYGDGADIKNLEGCTAQDYLEQRVTLTSIEEKIEDFWLKGVEKTDHGWDWNGPNNEVPNRHASAEITSILKIAEKIRAEDQDAEIEVKLLATDTALSLSAAKLISEFPFGQFRVNIQDFDPQKDYIPSLGVHPTEEQNKKQYYDEGLQQLVERLIGEKGMIKKAKKEKIKPVINFSGGYKAIIPFLTIIAQLEDIPMYYIYEESDHLMEVGNLPFNFDWASVERLHYYLGSDVLKQSDLHEDIKTELKNKKLVVETPGIKVSPLGELFQKARDLMPDGGGTFGKFVEIKLWEHFVKNPLNGYGYGLPIRGEVCYQNTRTKKVVGEIPEDEKGQRNYTKIEIDLTMYSENGDYAVLESKSLNGIKSIKPELYFEGAKFWHDGKLPKIFIVTFYKYEHENIQNREQQIKALKERVRALGVSEFRAYYFNLPLSKDKARVNYQVFIDAPDLNLVDALKELNLY
jgi:hypothetical protein